MSCAAVSFSPTSTTSVRMNAVYERFFPVPRPARTTVGTQLLGFKVEIDCVALLPTAE